MYDLNDFVIVLKEFMKVKCREGERNDEKILNWNFFS